VSAAPFDAARSPWVVLALTQFVPLTMLAISAATTAGVARYMVADSLPSVAPTSIFIPAAAGKTLRITMFDEGAAETSGSLALIAAASAVARLSPLSPAASVWE